MKQTVDYLINLARSGDEQSLVKIGELQKEIIEEREKYFILKDE